MYIACIFKKKTKKNQKNNNCDLLPLGSLFLGTELSPSLSVFFVRADLGKKKGGATSVDFRVTG